jgi:hypothetical protein
MTEIHLSAVLSLSCSAEDLSSQDLALTLFEIATRPGHRTTCVVTLIPIGWYSIIVADHTHIDDTRTCTVRASCCCEVGRPERLHDQPHGSYYDTITCRLMHIALVSSVCESSGYLVGGVNAASRSPILLAVGGPRTHDWSEHPQAQAISGEAGDCVAIVLNINDAAAWLCLLPGDNAGH